MKEKNEGRKRGKRFKQLYKMFWMMSSHSRFIDDIRDSGDAGKNPNTQINLNKSSSAVSSYPLALFSSISLHKQFLTHTHLVYEHIVILIPKSDQPGQNPSSLDAYDVCFTDLSLSDQVSLLSSFLLVTET